MVTFILAFSARGAGSPGGQGGPVGPGCPGRQCGPVGQGYLSGQGGPGELVIKFVNIYGLHGLDNQIIQKT